MCGTFKHVYCNKALKNFRLKQGGLYITMYKYRAIRMTTDIGLQAIAKHVDYYLIFINKTNSRRLVLSAFYSLYIICLVLFSLTDRCLYSFVCIV